MKWSMGIAVMVLLVLGALRSWAKDEVIEIDDCGDLNATLSNGACICNQGFVKVEGTCTPWWIVVDGGGLDDITCGPLGCDSNLGVPGNDDYGLPEDLPAPVRMSASELVGDIYFNEIERQPGESEIAYEARIACVENIRATAADLAMSPEQERKFLLVLHWAHEAWSDFFARYMDKRAEARERGEDPTAVPYGGSAVMTLIRRSADKQLGTFLTEREVTRVGAAGLPNPISCRNALLTHD